MSQVSEVPTPDSRVRMFHTEEVDCFAVVSQCYVVVVDTFSTPEEAQQMMDQLRGDLLGRQFLVINTHQHYDHTWGNRIFAAEGPYPAPIIAHRKSVEMLQAQGQEAQQYLSERQAQDPRFANVQIVPPTLSFSECLSIHGGDLTLELIPAPGHSQDQMVVWIPEIRFLLAADALEFPFPYAAEPADLPVLLQTMRQLEQFGAQTILPCHGGVHGGDLVQRNLAYFARLQSACEQAKLAGPISQKHDETALSGLAYEEVLEEMGLGASSVSSLYRDFHRRNIEATLRNIEATLRNIEATLYGLEHQP